MNLKGWKILHTRVQNSANESNIWNQFQKSSKIAKFLDCIPKTFVPLR